MNMWVGLGPLTCCSHTHGSCELRPCTACCNILRRGELVSLKVVLADGYVVSLVSQARPSYVKREGLACETIINVSFGPGGFGVASHPGSPLRRKLTWCEARFGEQ